MGEWAGSGGECGKLSGKFAGALARKLLGSGGGSGGVLACGPGRRDLWRKASAEGLLQEWRGRKE